MTRRWTATALGILLALTGCSAGDDAAAPSKSRSPTSSATPSATTPTPTPSETEPAATLSVSPEAEEFVAVVREKLGDVARGRSDAEIAAVADLTCRALASGTTPDQLIALVQSLGTLDASATDAATARELVKLAIDTICPEEADQVDNY